MLIRLILNWFRSRRKKDTVPLKEGLDTLDLPFPWREVSSYLVETLKKKQWHLSTTDFRSMLVELAKEGFEAYKVGEFRLTFLHRDGWVIKLPYHPKGKEQLKREIFIRNRMDMEKTGHFPEMYLVEDFMVIQRRYDINLALYQKHSAEIIAKGKQYSIPDVFYKNVGFDENERWYFLDFGA